MNIFAEHGHALFNIVMLCGSLMLIHIMREENQMQRESDLAVQDSYERALLDTDTDDGE